MNESQQVQMEPLSPMKAQQISVGLSRYRELKGNNLIINPRDEAEITGLEKFFGDVMIQHGPELMGCWIAVRQEYEPLVQVIERIATRIKSISAHNKGAAQ